MTVGGITAITADALLNRLETILNKELILSIHLLFPAEKKCFIVDVSHKLAICVRTLQYGKSIVLSHKSSFHCPLYTILVSEEDQPFC